MHFLLFIVVLLCLGIQLALGAAMLVSIHRGGDRTAYWSALGTVTILLALSIYDGAMLMRWWCLGVRGFNEYVDEDIAIPFLALAWATTLAAALLAARRRHRRMVRVLAAGIIVTLLVSCWQGRYTLTCKLTAQKRYAVSRLLVATLSTSDFNVYGPVPVSKRGTQRDYLNPSFFELAGTNGWSALVEAMAPFQDTNVEHVEKALGIAERADDWTTYLALVRALAVRAHPHIPRWTNVAEAPMRRGSTDTCVAIYREALAARQQNPSEIRFSFLDLALEAVETSYLDAFLSIDAKSWLEQTSPQVLNLLLEKTLNRAYEHGATAVERKLFRDRLVTLLRHGFDLREDTPLRMFCRNHVATVEAERVLNDATTVRRSRYGGWAERTYRKAIERLERVRRGMEVVLPVLLELTPASTTASRDAEGKSAYDLCAANAPSLRDLDVVRALKGH